MKGDNQIPKVIKKVLPAVISITASKYLPIFENPGEEPKKWSKLPKTPKEQQKMGQAGILR